MSADLEMAYLKHKQSLLAIALNITHCQAMAEDAIQIAFSNLVQKHDRAIDLESYVFKTVRNAAIDLVRRRVRETNKVESFFAAQNENGHLGMDRFRESQINNAIRLEDQLKIQEAIDALPASDREIILLKIFSGFTFEKIAEITDSNSSTVATRYRRLLEKLKSKLKEHA